MANKWLKGDWTWAGFLLFIAQVAWIGAILNLFVYSLLFIIQIIQGDFYFGMQLPIAIEIQNLSEQFNSQLPTEAIDFYFDKRVKGKVDIIGEVPIPDLFLHIVSLMKLVGSAVAVFVLGLIKGVLRPLTRGNPFQLETSKNLYWIGGIILSITPAKFLYEWIVYEYMSQFPLPENLSVLWPLPDYSYLITGLIVLSIAYVFKKGARMAREQQLTV